MSKVFVGLSGGVDSAVAALLLQKQGHDVVGVFMKNWSGVTAGVKCPWEQDYASAQAVAAHLQIALKLFDFEKLYRKTVGKYLIDSYASGLTPNPDIMCNEEIKFKAFYEKCRKSGADFIATGHYGRLDNGHLLRGIDECKDQSYFLYRVSLKVLKNVIFPLGELTKQEVRKIAHNEGFPNADRAESMGICFVGEVPMKDFLHEFIDYKTGYIVDQNGRKIGEHDGVFFYTIGQRHGLGIGGGKPYYVYKKDIKKNLLYVTNEANSSLLMRNSFELDNCIWNAELNSNKKYLVQVRHRSKAIPAFIKHNKTKNKYTIELSKSERAIAAGQSAVVYDGDMLVGGGIIVY